jgi:hypothetical protein
MFYFNSSVLLHVPNILYIHLQEDYDVHAALYGRVFTHLHKQSRIIFLMMDIHSFTSLSHDRTKASSKASSPHSAI